MAAVPALDVASVFGARYSVVAVAIRLAVYTASVTLLAYPLTAGISLVGTKPAFVTIFFAITIKAVLGTVAVSVAFSIADTVIPAGKARPTGVVVEAHLPLAAKVIAENIAAED